MYISDFNYHKPLSIKEACQILAESPDSAPLAGGTDLLVEIKQGLRYHQDIVSLAEIKQLKTLYEDANNLYIGAGVTHNTIAASLIVKKSFLVIAEAASRIGTEQIRNTGTIGGNLCTGASCCDMAPILLALNARVEIVSYTKERIVSLKEFFIFHRETCLEKGEIMTKIIVPRAKSGTGSCFKKFGLREAASISVASVATSLMMNNDICTDACVVIGAVAPTPKISNKANEVLKGSKIAELSENSSILKQAGQAAAEDSIPINDLRGSIEYRRHIIKVLTQGTIINAIIRAST